MDQANINEPEVIKTEHSPAGIATAPAASADTDNRQPKRSPVLRRFFAAHWRVDWFSNRSSISGSASRGNGRQCARRHGGRYSPRTAFGRCRFTRQRSGTRCRQRAGRADTGQYCSGNVARPGDPNAPVTIVEYSDYQCPFCLRHFQQTMPLLKAEYIDTGRVYYVFKDFPITSLHPVAPRIHEAARCAGEIGGSDAYWQAHDTFFTNNQQLPGIQQPDLDNLLVALLDEVALDEAAVRDCLESGRYTEAVNVDLAEGRQLGITGTLLFVNGYPVPGAQPYEVFQQVIALAEEGRLAEAYQTQPAVNNEPAPSDRPVTVPLSGDEPAKGSADAPITIVEYSDFQCPFCQRHFQQTLPQLQSYIEAGQVRYIFKDFPILNIHPEAQKAHESAAARLNWGR